MTPQDELLYYQEFAIALKEGPQGTNRQRADALRGGSITSLLWMLWAGGLSVAILLAQLGKLDRPAPKAVRLEQASHRDHSATTTANPRPHRGPHTSAPISATPVWHQPVVSDPAAAMQGRFHASTRGGSFAALDTGLDHYRKLSGTLARVQSVALRKRSEANRLPRVFINRTNDCFSRPSIGMFSRRCEVIKIDYRDHQRTYEYPVEIEVVLAHEWGHHLIHISGEKMSPIEEEVVCDCTAGMVFGYYAKHGLINQDEAFKAFRLIADVGNNSAHGHHPNAEVRLKSFWGGLMSIAAPHEPQAQESIAFCSSLKRVLDLQKVQNMGLTWSA